jgi:hypothetical protein
MSDRFKDWDAAYVLGMLSSDERREFEDHLASCAECSAAVTELAGMPGMLSRLPAREAIELVDAEIELSPLPQLATRLAHIVDARRRRTRVRTAVVAIGSAAAIAAGSFVLGAVAAQPAVHEVAMTPASATTPIDARLAVTSKGWGTRFDWHCDYPGEVNASWGPITYDLVVTTRAGEQSVVASWTAHGSGANNLSASTSVPTSEIATVDIRLAGADDALATLTPTP